jgi:hypothetical protein
MLKTILIALRRKPKPVREQVAFWSAGLCVLCVFGIWAFTIPDNFTTDVSNNGASLFSSFRNNFQQASIDLEAVKTEFDVLSGTTTDAVDMELKFASSTIERRLPQATSTFFPELNPGRPIRLATTSADTVSTTTEL